MHELKVRELILSVALANETAIREFYAKVSEIVMRSRSKMKLFIRHFASRGKGRGVVVAVVFAIAVAMMALIGIRIASESGTHSSGAPAIRAPAIRPTSCTAPRNAPGGADPWGGCWPGPANTGVPADTVLKNVPQDVSSGPGWTWNASVRAIYVTGCDVILDSLNINGEVLLRDGNGTQSAATPCVTIKNSKINGVVDVDDACLVRHCGPLVMTDDEIAVPEGSDLSNLQYTNFYVWRINSHGGNGTLHCNGHCEIYNSWIHGFYLEGAFHYNAIGSNGDGKGPFVVDHNYLSCGDFWANSSDTSPAAGCSDDLGLFGDFGPIANVTITRNYFAPAIPGKFWSSQPAWCIDTNNPAMGKPYPYATNEVVTYNVFARGHNGKCGVYGPVYSWQSGRGDVFSGNVWDDGSKLNLP